MLFFMLCICYIFILSVIFIRKINIIIMLIVMILFYFCLCYAYFSCIWTWHTLLHMVVLWWKMRSTTLLDITSGIHFIAIISHRWNCATLLAITITVSIILYLVLWLTKIVCIFPVRVRRTCRSGTNVHWFWPWEQHITRTQR